MPPATATNHSAPDSTAGSTANPTSLSGDASANEQPEQQPKQAPQQTAPQLLTLKTLPTYSLKNRALKQLHLLLYRSGLSSLYGRLTASPAATIVMYHSIPAAHEVPWMDPCNCLSAEKFEAQIRFLANACHVISVAELTEQLKAGVPLRPGTVAITFDDGYLNNLTVAAPILAKYNLPATLYLATNYIEAGKNQWIDTLYSAFRARSRHQLSLPAIKASNHSERPEQGDGQTDYQADRQADYQWDLSDADQQQAAYAAIIGYLIEATAEQRQQLLADIDQQLLPTAYPPRLTMNWDEVRQMQQQYPNITLGVHTANHLDLSTHTHQALAELQQSVAQVEAETGHRPEHLAFPYNRYNDEAIAQVKAANLKSAVAEAPDPVVRGHSNCYSLPRLEGPQSLTMLKSWTSGGFPDLSQRLLRRCWTRPY